MVREYPSLTFERYCDDAVVHCTSERQARQVQDAIAARLAQVGLELHPDKTRVVYCKDADRRGSFEHTSFTFLGYTFRPRLRPPEVAERRPVDQAVCVTSGSRNR